MLIKFKEILVKDYFLNSPDPAQSIEQQRLSIYEGSKKFNQFIEGRGLGRKLKKILNSTVQLSRLPNEHNFVGFH